MTDRSATWLHLLASDAPAEDLGASRARFLADPAVPPAERARIEEEASAAGRVRELLTAGRRHSRELVVLNDLARRLGSMHDPGEVLQEVAAQSRRLLDADVAYLMLRRPEGLRIEVVDGSMGGALRGITLREGEGIGGEVLRTGRPMWTESYLTDPRVRKLAHMHVAARSEQLGGILGLPLQVGGETIGVLLAGDRRARRFADHDIELLAGLAAHAAVALRNAQLIDQLRGTAGELERRNAELRRSEEQRERAAALRDLVTTAVIGGGGVPAVARALERAVGGEVQVWDLTGRRLDAAPPPGGPGIDAVGPADRASVADWLAVPGPRAVRAGGRPGMVTPVALTDGPAGCLVVWDVDGTDPELSGLLQTAATSLALVVVTERAVALAELRSRGEFVQSLLAGDGDDAAARRRGRSAGVDLDAVTSVAVLDPGPGDLQPAARAAARLAEGARGWSAEHQGRVVVLLTGPDAEDACDWLHAPGAPLPAAVGVAPCSGGAAAVRAAHEEARQTATLLHALGRPDVAATSAAFGVYRALLSPAGRGELRTFIRATLGPVLDWDEQRNRNLVDTVASFLRNAQHHARTCAELHVHANTLYQRLDRVTELLGPDWRDPDRVLQLQLALVLRSLAAAVPQAG
ncbi:helix-turn-helix domain-containing protein [Blastococcus xanthinilyticus]|uniref:PucR-like helix-turn-helix protein n=1 Tax=Blastococcus xanthinilyticus TaxID=1564164 RepID=A0A5S5CYL6_9ACTN|nr:GAF domain-containing protein [Blastococcus xanthinilyticus]TYP88870.1 PucR-like helix-turn-helix protein [Blastococcus xanthinilyticus]